LPSTIEHLRRQTVKDQLEVVLVTSDPDAVGLDEATANNFCRVRVIDTGQIASTVVRGMESITGVLTVMNPGYLVKRFGW
jgi:hypothetical protein